MHRLQVLPEKVTLPFGARSRENTRPVMGNDRSSVVRGSFFLDAEAENEYDNVKLPDTQIGICPQGGQPSRAQNMYSRFCPAPLGIVL